MANSIERWIINGTLPALLVILMLGLFTEPNLTGFVTSDGSYKSPTSDGSYKSPTSDNSYESPTVGPGYIAPKIDESWEAPKEGPGFQKPEVGPGFIRPEVGSGFVKPDTAEFTIINQTIDKPKKNESDKKLPKGPIDDKYVGGWTPYQLTNYWKKGGHKTAPTPTDLVLNLHKDGTWTWGRNEGTWEVSSISDEDWKKWGITGDFQKKIIFHGWPYGGVETTVDGPVEEIPTYVDYIWAVYDAEPPEVEDSAQAWLRFAPGPYTPKEEAVFSDLSLIGKWGIHAQGVVYKGRQGYEEVWEVKFATTTILELKDDKTWAFGDSKGTWKVIPIEKKDWKKWDLEFYGPKKKLVLEGWENEAEDSKNIADGPIEASSGQVDFFWINAWIKLDRAEPKPQTLSLKFRPYESASAYLTTQVIGSGKVTTDDNKINCNQKDDAWGARRGRFFMRYAWVTYVDQITGMATGDATQCTAEYEVNKEVELKAIPDEGWVFSGWKDACQGTDNICKITMDRSKTATAKFAPGCEDDSVCASEQKCENSICMTLQCGCGFAKEHECQKYECCSDNDCGEEMKCNLNVNRCVFKSECREVVIKGDPANKHDIVFVGYGFQDYEHMKQGINLLMDFESKSQSKLGVFSLTPFKENKNKFNVWMVMAPDYKHNEMPSGYEDLMLNVPEEGDYQRFVRTCDRDTVVVMSSQLFRSHAYWPTQDASGGRVYLSLTNPLTGPEYLGRTLAHELGHAIGGLADEYVEYNAGDRTERFDMPNCAPNLEKAKEKWGDLEGIRGVHYVTGIPDVPGTTYYKHPVPTFPELGFFKDGHDWNDGGCAYAYKNIRPTITSIMLDHYTFDNDYGPVNERVLNKKLEKYEPEPDDSWGARRGKFFLRNVW